MTQSVYIGCNYCKKPMEKIQGNYKCTTPGCGKGGLSSPAGVSVTVDEQGNVTITGGSKSTNEKAN